MFAFRNVLGLMLVLGGFAAAQVLVQPGLAMELPPPPTVTASVPSLPAPLPPPPPAPLPPPPAPLPPPPVTTPPLPPPPISPPPIGPPPIVAAPVAPPPAVAPPALLPRAAEAPPPPAPGTAAFPQEWSAPSAQRPSSTGWSGGETAHRRPETTTRRQRLEAKPHRTDSRVTVRLEFTLPTAQRVFLIVRGPAPSCRVAGVIPFRGRKGENTVTFAGRVHGRTLEPGVYLVLLSANRRIPADAPTEYVRVVSPRRSVPLPDGAAKPSCPDAHGLAAASSARLARVEPMQPLRPAPSRPDPSRPAAPLLPPPQSDIPEARDGNDDGIAGFVPSPDFLTPPLGDDSQPAATLAVLVILGTLLVTMLALVTRFLRGSWNP